MKDIKVIMGFAINKLSEEALETFSKMEEAKVMSFRFILYMQIS